MFIVPVVCGRDFFLGAVILFFALKAFPLLLTHRSMRLEKRWLVTRSHAGWSAPKSHSLYIVPLWVSGLFLIYDKKKLLWWELSDALIYMLYGYSNITFRIILLFCSFCRIILVPLRSMIYLFRGSCNILTVSGMGFVLWSGLEVQSKGGGEYSNNIGATITPVYCTGMSGLWVAKFIAEW